MTARRDTLPTLTERLPLGSAGLTVSPICCGMTFDARVIPAAFEAGINFFFVSADMHWPLYEGVRKGLDDLLRDHPSRRDEIVVACVAYVTQPEFCWAPYEEVLEAVPALGHLDVTLAGGSYGHEIAKRAEIYLAHRQIGHVGVRAVGATFHDRAAALEAIRADQLDIAYLRYNPVHPGALTEVFPHVPPRGDQRKTLVYNFKSTAAHVDNDEHFAEMGVTDENWKPHITDYYRFALTSPALDGLLVGLPSPEAVTELADALAKGPVDEEDHQYMLELGMLERRRREALKRKMIVENARKLGLIPAAQRSSDS